MCHFKALGTQKYATHYFNISCERSRFAYSYLHTHDGFWASANWFYLSPMYLLRLQTARVSSSLLMSTIHCCPQGLACDGCPRRAGFDIRCRCATSASDTTLRPDATPRFEDTRAHEFQISSLVSLIRDAMLLRSIGVDEF